MWPAFLLIRVEQFRRRLSPGYQGKLPGEIGSVTNTLAHALGHERRRHMRGIARQHDPTTTPFVGDERMEYVGRGPPELAILRSLSVGAVSDNVAIDPDVLQGFAAAPQDEMTQPNRRWIPGDRQANVAPDLD
jgi:hypothetical protein